MLEWTCNFMMSIWEMYLIIGGIIAFIYHIKRTRDVKWKTELTGNLHWLNWRHYLELLIVVFVYPLWIIFKLTTSFGY